MHRLSDGVFIGQFGQAKPWDINDTSNITRKPRYVREWKLKLKILRNELLKKLKPKEEEKDEIESSPKTKKNKTSQPPSFKQSPARKQDKTLA